MKQLLKKYKLRENTIFCTMKKAGYNILYLFFTAIIIFYFIEVIYYQNFLLAFEHITFINHIRMNIVNICIIVIFETVILLLLNNMGLCFGVTALITYILVIINELKMNARGEAFTFNDFTVVKEALLVAGNYDLKISVIDVQVLFLLFGLFVAFTTFIPKKFKIEKKLSLRFMFALICLGIFLAFWMNVEDIIEMMGGNGRYIYMISDYYDENGYLAGIARTTPHKLQEPEGYSKKAIDSIQESITYEESTNFPNILFVMNESLYDISMLEGIRFNRDPLEKLKDLQKKYSYGNFISPTYGGGTCNVEFEVLTGCPLHDVGSGILPYSDMIHNDVITLVSLMNNNGYRTVAFHPNIGSYFNRRQVYNYMGFQEVYFSEEMGELPKEGLYASDTELYKKVIEQYEVSKHNGTPFFSYIITMQNHGGYSYDYSKNGIEIIENEIFEREQELHTYVNLTSSSIDAFEYLINYFENIEEPTVIVMFGDHIPAIDSFGYKYESKMNTEGHLFAITPLIVYSNYDLPYEDWGYVNAYSLTAKILDYCGVSMDDFFVYELEKSNLPTINDWFYINNQWEPLDSLNSEIVRYKENLWMMAYDRLFGNKYGGLKNR